MESRTKRKIKSGLEFEQFFPAANLTNETVKKGASVSDTVKFIPKVVRETLSQTKKIAEHLQGTSLSETCKNIWQFVYEHIAYAKDEDGLEQIRAPARSWHDRFRGVDCDCYTVFISSILTNLKIPHSLRIAKYHRDYFQHIYPVVHKKGGGQITLDCVVDDFNYEEPYTEIKDTKMDLQYLSGVNDDTELFADENQEGLGKKRKKLKDILKNGLHAVNRANPATVLLRNGILASMKLNIMKVAQRLKYAYLSDEQAQKKNVDEGRLQKLQNVKDKREPIFYGVGGKLENVQKGILTGKGNQKDECSGLGNYGEEFSGVYDESTPLSELLGKEIYESENDSLGELGEPVTAASITASTGALAAISALLNNIGSIFKKKEDKGADDFKTSDKDDDPKNVPAEIQDNKKEIAKLDEDAKNNPDDSSDDSGADEKKDDSGSKTFWDKNKSWIKPTAIGATGIGLLYLGYVALTSEKEEKHQKQLSGTKNKSPHHKKKGPVAMI